MQMGVRLSALVCGLCAALAVGATVAGAGSWDAESFRNEDTLDFFTAVPDEGEHWSRVWLVVLDGTVYIRLGSRAASRMEKHSGAPVVKVRIAGQEFDRVRADATPDKATAVAEAMGDKYWSDALIRFLPHPLTMRLVPEAPE
jgi:hypothetical protein